MAATHIVASYKNTIDNNTPCGLKYANRKVHVYCIYVQTFNNFAHHLWTYYKYAVVALVSFTIIHEKNSGDPLSHGSFSSCGDMIDLRLLDSNVLALQTTISRCEQSWQDTRKQMKWRHIVIVCWKRGRCNGAPPREYLKLKTIWPSSSLKTWKKMKKYN